MVSEVIFTMRRVACGLTSRSCIVKGIWCTIYHASLLHVVWLLVPLSCRVYDVIFTVRCVACGLVCRARIVQGIISLPLRVAYRANTRATLHQLASCLELAPRRYNALFTCSLWYTPLANTTHLPLNTCSRQLQDLDCSDFFPVVWKTEVERWILRDFTVKYHIRRCVY